MLESIAKQYGFPENECTLQPFGNGLINNTWILPACFRIGTNSIIGKATSRAICSKIGYGKKPGSYALSKSAIWCALSDTIISLTASVDT